MRPLGAAEIWEPGEEACPQCGTTLEDRVDRTDPAQPLYVGERCPRCPWDTDFEPRTQPEEQAEAWEDGGENCRTCGADVEHKVNRTDPNDPQVRGKRCQECGWDVALEGQTARRQARKVFSR